MILTRRQQAELFAREGASRLRALWQPRGASAPLISQRAVAGPVPWVIAIMTALTVIAAAAGLALGSITRTAEADLAGGITVQIAGPAAPEADRQARAAVAALTALDGVGEVRRLSAAERADLLRPWLGDAGLGDAGLGDSELGDAGLGDAGAGEDLLVLPELIELRLAPGSATDPDRVAALRAALAKVAPDASVSADMAWLAPLRDAIAALQWLAVALVGLLVTATAAAVLLASRSALAANRDTIEIMHLLGAQDIQVARMFQRSAAISAAAGGAWGFAVAQLAILLLAGRFAALGPGNTAAGLRWYDWALLVLIPLAGVLLAAVTARITVLATLRRMP